MFIDLENIKTATTLFTYLDKATKYRFRGNHTPLEIWTDNWRHCQPDIEFYYLGLDVDVPDQCLFYDKTTARGRYHDQKIITASEYLKSISHDNVILLNKEVLEC